MELRCIHCGLGIKTLFVQYSPGNIRLMKCENCKAVADEYIECEFMILLIDLILHKPKAYRHLLFNTIHRETVDFEGLLWKSNSIFLTLDACRILLLNRSKQECASSGAGFSSSIWGCGKIIVDVLFGNFMFLCILFLTTRIFLRSLSKVIRCEDILLANLVSSYFKIILVAMMVWEFPRSVIYIIDILVASSNMVALKVLTQSTMTRCIGVCFSAHVAKLIAGNMLDVLLPISFRVSGLMGC